MQDRTGIVSYQGEPGAYSHQACVEALPNMKAVPATTFEGAIDMVREGKADLAMIPVENSTYGRVADVHQLLPESGLHIVGEHFVRVHINLLGLPGAKLEEITRAQSHAVLLGQCREFLKEHNIARLAGFDTAGAARDVKAAGDSTLAALASPLAGEIYGLDVLAAEIEDNRTNTTRFLVMAPEAALAPAPGQRPKRGSLRLLPSGPDRVGEALARANLSANPKGSSMTLSDTILFGAETIDRAAHLRDKAGDLLRDPNARSTVFWRGKAMFKAADGDAPRLAWLPAQASLNREAQEAPIFLGMRDNAPHFAHDISAWEAPDAEAVPGFIDTSVVRHPEMGEDEAFLDLRATMGRLDPVDAGDAAAAKGIFGWHESHRFCAVCGSPSAVSLGGWRRTCTVCGAHHFPRTDPVVIMLVFHRDRLLLGRSPGWPEGMVSLLAGFIEPGETIEAAVRRETVEEAGIRVGAVGYIASQPWPFPASLMIGCWGVAETDAITLDPAELEDAFWVTREDVMAERLKPEPRFRTARRGAIAHRLIDEWLAGRISPET